jgi:hypothetical protein
MSRFPRPAVALLGVALSLAPSTAQGPAAGKDALRSLSYSELGQQVRGLKGKVVVVYFWSFG